MQIKKLFYSKDIDDQRILLAHWNRALIILVNNLEV